jgi:hypothetical protein
MLKSTLAFALLALLLSFAPSQAQTMTCSDADMMKMQTQANAVTDAKKKEMAMKEMTMAKDMMAQKKTDDCMMHMKNAEKAMQ